MASRASSDVAVIVPTLRRPDSLARALRSLLVQTDGPALIAEIVVVDNAPEGSARATVAELARSAPVPVRYVHEARPGVATARNSGLAASRAPYVAFLDDDEEAPPGWLAALRDAHVRYGADVTFGPVCGVADGAKPWARPYMDRFFSRIGPAKSGVIEQSYGCGCSMMTRATALAGPAPFDVAANDTGGEDDRLFMRLRGQGVRFAWAADAWVREYAPPDRVRLSYALTRAIGYGQSPSQSAWRRGRPVALAGWMVMGAVQAPVYAAYSALLWLLRRPERAEAAEKAARGLGKVIWFRRLRFYGAGAVRKSAPVTPSPATSWGRARRVASATKITQMKWL